jgi:hypothetical protein
LGCQGADGFLFQHQEPSLNERPDNDHHNSHDCHVMLTVFLPIVIKAIGLEYVKMVITQMCYFFGCIT